MRPYVATVLITLILTSWSIHNSYGQEMIKLNSNDTFPVGHYTVTFSKNCKADKLEWYLKWLTLDTGNVQGSLGIEGRYKYNMFTGQPPYHFSMEFIQLAIDNENLRSLPAEKLADTLARSAFMNVKNELAMNGALSLISSQFIIDSTGGKKYTVLAFVVKKKVPLLTLPQNGESLAQVSWQYFYIPESPDKKYIIMANYYEILSRTLYSDSYSPRFYYCFREVLGSLKLRE